MAQVGENGIHAVFSKRARSHMLPAQMNQRIEKEEIDPAEVMSAKSFVTVQSHQYTMSSMRLSRLGVVSI